MSNFKRDLESQGKVEGEHLKQMLTGQEAETQNAFERYSGGKEKERAQHSHSAASQDVLKDPRLVKSQGGGQQQGQQRSEKNERMARGVAPVDHIEVAQKSVTANEARLKERSDTPVKNLLARLDAKTQERGSDTPVKDLLARLDAKSHGAQEQTQERGMSQASQSQSQAPAIEMSRER